jgi:hypothetical protein
MEYESVEGKGLIGHGICFVVLCRITKSYFVFRHRDTNILLPKDCLPKDVSLVLLRFNRRIKG